MLSPCPSTPKPTCTRVIGSGGCCTRLSKFSIGGVCKSSEDDTQCFILLLMFCLSGFDFEHGKVSRRSDFTHCYFYNPLERKWLEHPWFGKYGISWHLSVLLQTSESRLQWQGCIHVIHSCIVKTKSAIAIMQNVFCSAKA